MAKRPSLGKGLEALLGQNNPELPISSTENHENQLLELQVSQITRNPQQPRQVFEDESLRELADSIRSNGVVQPIIVRPVEQGYELVAGERRWLASQQAGLDTIPVIVKAVNDVDALVIALIENLQRDDLNTFEEAQALHRLYTEFGLTQGAIGEAIGKSRTTVNNLIRLMNLDQSILQLLANEKLEEGHARALLGVENESRRKSLARDVVTRDLTVRQLEAKIRQLAGGKRKAPKAPQSADLINLQRRLSDELGLLVKIKESKPGKSGVLAIHYQSLEKLHEVLKLLGEE